MGGGVIGVTTSWYLAAQGHEVTVIDRQPAVGMETSYANAGQISPGYSAPWAGPGVPLKALKWLAMKHRPFVVWPSLDPQLWRWVAQMACNCTTDAYRRNKSRMVRLAEYSRDVLDTLRSDLGLDFDDRQAGTLQVFRTVKQMDAAAADIRILEQSGVAYTLLDREGCVAAEPGLATSAGKFVGGLQLPGDQTGDAYLFTRRLAELAAERGVKFLGETRVKALIRNGQRIRSVETSRGTLRADAYVMALGSYSTAFARSLGLRLPVYPVKGYSLTATVIDDARAPLSTVMDETYKIAITRLGDRIRVGGTVELAGFNTALRAPRRATLVHSANDLFPGAGDLDGASFWTGLRPMTPDGTPVVGETPYENLYLNTGHGTLGWTMACGSARVLSDLISKRVPEIESQDLGIGRYASL